MKLGDCFRLGSVGLVVTEVKLPGEEIRRLDSSIVQFLKDEALAFDSDEDLAALAMEESAMDISGRFGGGGGGGESEAGDGEYSSRDASPQQWNTPGARASNHSLAGTSLASEGATERGTEWGSERGDNNNNSNNNSPSSSPLRFAGMTMGERYICYMCYETHDTPEDPLVAPCDCRGDTRYLHVQCLHKWYQTSLNTHRAQVIRITGSGAPACKICGGAYKTTFKKSDGSKASILEMDTDGPYLAVVVVTRHDTNPGLFNTKFRLNFSPQTLRTNPAANDLGLGGEPAPAPVIVGRSSSCGMMLDYRTVSTVHAKVFYQVSKRVSKHCHNAWPLPLALILPFPTYLLIFCHLFISFYCSFLPLISSLLSSQPPCTYPLLTFFPNQSIFSSL